MRLSCPGQSAGLAYQHTQSWWLPARSAPTGGSLAIFAATETDPHPVQAGETRNFKLNRRDIKPIR